MMYVAEFYKNGIRDLRPRIDYTRYEGYGLIDSVDGELKEGDILYIGGSSNCGMTAISKDLDWSRKNAFPRDVHRVVYKLNSFMPYEEAF